jgi:hypothetical protein
MLAVYDAVLRGGALPGGEASATQEDYDRCAG